MSHNKEYNIASSVPQYKKDMKREESKSRRIAKKFKKETEFDKYKYKKI